MCNRLMKWAYYGIVVPEKLKLFCPLHPQSTVPSSLSPRINAIWPEDRCIPEELTREFNGNWIQANNLGIYESHIRIVLQNLFHVLDRIIEKGLIHVLLADLLLHALPQAKGQEHLRKAAGEKFAFFAIFRTTSLWAPSRRNCCWMVRPMFSMATDLFFNWRNSITDSCGKQMILLMVGLDFIVPRSANSPRRERWTETACNCLDSFPLCLPWNAHRKWCLPTWLPNNASNEVIQRSA